MIQNLRRADRAHSRDHGRHADRTRHSHSGNREIAGHGYSDGSGWARCKTTCHHQRKWPATWGFLGSRAVAFSPAMYYRVPVGPVVSGCARTYSGRHWGAGCRHMGFADPDLVIAQGRTAGGSPRRCYAASRHAVRAWTVSPHAGQLVTLTAPSCHVSPHVVVRRGVPVSTDVWGARGVRRSVCTVGVPRTATDGCRRRRFRLEARRPGGCASRCARWARVISGAEGLGRPAKAVR
jgi:hypothetical protein